MVFFIAFIYFESASSTIKFLKLGLLSFKATPSTYTIISPKYTILTTLLAFI